MSFDIKVKNKDCNIKFNYANKKLGTKDADGNSQNDGAGILFVQVLEKEDDALVNLLQLVDKNFTENDVLEAVQNYTDNLVNSGMGEEEAYNQIFADLKEEMLASGFFVSKIRKYKENLEKAHKVIAARETEESKLQADELKKLAERITKEIS